MFRRLVPLLALAILAASPAGSALAAPSCTADISTLRYRPHYTVSCAGQTIDTVQLVKTSNGASVGITTNGLTTSDVTVDGNGTLASNKQYRLKLWVDDGLGGGAVLWTQTFRTLKPPAHANLHVKYITAIPADAVLDMAHRIDKANVVAVPTNADFIDASTRSLSSSAYAAALKHHQSALVVTDLPILNGAGLGAALNQFCNNGHGVVLAGQTHWRADAATPWNVTSAVGAEGGPEGAGGEGAGLAMGGGGGGFGEEPELQLPSTSMAATRPDRRTAASRLAMCLLGDPRGTGFPLSGRDGLTKSSAPSSKE